jgi:hypothetical protein
MTIIKLINIIEKPNFEKKNAIHYKAESKGFIFNYMNRDYIVSVHHFKSIVSTTFENIRLNPIYDILWNELAIFESIENETGRFKPIKKYSVILNTLSNLYMETINGQEIFDFVDTTVKYIIPHQPTIYIRVNIKNPVYFKGLSGSPVFDNNMKLIGVFCKMEYIDNIYYGLILPTIYIIKSLNKKDNMNSFLLDLPLGLSNKLSNYKFGKYKIYEKDNIYTIYHESLKIYIPLDVYINLDGDEDNSINITNMNTKEKNIIKYITDERFDSSLNIIIKENKYKLNMGLLTCIRNDNTIDMKKLELEKLSTLKDIWLQI